MAESLENVDVAVVGAGIMGLSTAKFLRERGAEVAVVDAWEPAHPLGTSSSESRIIRSFYGNELLYMDWARRSLDLWASWEEAWGRRLLYRTGVLWFVGADDRFESASARAFEEAGWPFERLSIEELGRRYPQIGATGLDYLLFEPEAGALLAREAILRLAQDVASSGGRIVRGFARLGERDGRRLSALRLGAERLAARTFVFAGGPWLPKVFPELFETLIRVTRQDELYFGVPSGKDDYDWTRCPTWVEMGKYYGVPALEGRGFKVGVDSIGPEFDPDEDARVVSDDNVERARGFLRRRFPGLAEAPLTATRACTYSTTCDQHLIVDRHPAMDNVWILGGGSGHAFKLGPVLGDYAARLVAEEAEGPPDPALRFLGRREKRWRDA